jgi:hypothetical protein
VHLSIDKIYGAGFGINCDFVISLDPAIDRVRVYGNLYIDMTKGQVEISDGGTYLLLVAARDGSMVYWLVLRESKHSSSAYERIGLFVFWAYPQLSAGENGWLGDETKEKWAELVIPKLALQQQVITLV